MQPCQYDLQPQFQKIHRITHTKTTIITKHITRTKRPKSHPSHTRGRTHEVPFIAGSSHFTQKNTSFHVPASSPNQNPYIIHASSPLPFITISLHHHFPSSPLPIVTTSHRPHLPSAPLPFITTSHRHHFPSSPLPFITTSHRHHFPSTPLPFVTTLSRSVLFFCYILLLYCDVMYHPSS